MGSHYVLQCSVYGYCILKLLKIKYDVKDLKCKNLKCGRDAASWVVLVDCLELRVCIP